MRTASLFDDPPALVDLLPVIFLLYPDAATLTRLQERWRGLRARLGLSASCVLNFHVTLFQVGPQSKLSRDQVAAAKAAGDSLIAAPFDLEFDRVMTFPNRQDKQPFVMLARDGSPGCVEFQRQLALAARTAGAIKSKVHYQPHLTLAYDPQHVEPIDIEPFRWTAREFALTRSDPNNGTHDKLATWPLSVAKGEA